MKATVEQLDSVPHPEIQSLPLDEKPYWTIERARVKDTAKVPVELVVNGKSVANKLVAADGSVKNLSFDCSITQSSWVAIRILPAAHTPLYSCW